MIEIFVSDDGTCEVFYDGRPYDPQHERDFDDSLATIRRTEPRGTVVTVIDPDGYRFEQKI